MLDFKQSFLYIWDYGCLLYTSPGREEIQQEEIKADDESGKNETEEENKY